jgi:carbon monoxide dehydrogenase subunit G
MNVEVAVEIEASKEVVWSAITDIENSAKMISGIENVEILNMPGSGVVGLKWIETRKMFGKEATETMWITESVENQHYQTRAESHGAVYVSSLSLQEQGPNTKLIMSFDAQAQSLLAKVMSFCTGFLVKGSMRKMIMKDLQDIKNYTES